MWKSQTALAVSATLFAAQAGAAITFVDAGDTPFEDTGTISGTIALPTGMAAGDAMLIPLVMTTDNDGTEAISDPTGTWTILESASIGGTSLSIALYCRIHDGSEADPTLAAINTDAADLMIASVAAFRGTHDSCADIEAHINETTTSGATVDIPTAALTVTTPNTVIVSFGAKKIGWASAATLDTDGLGWAEIQEYDTTVAGDGGLAWDYVIQTTATSISADTFVITTPSGTGASASIIVSLKPLDTCSVAPTIVDVDEDNIITSTQANVSIDQTDGCDTGTVTLEQSGNVKTLSQDSYSATETVVDISGAGPGVADGLIFGAATIRVANSAGNDTHAVTITEPSGTQSRTLSGGLLTLDYDDFGNPNRVSGTPIDVLAASQVAYLSATGCPLDALDGAADTGNGNTGVENDEDDVYIRVDGSYKIGATCTAFNIDYTDDDGSGGSHLYIGTLATQTWKDSPPVMGSTDITDHVLAVGLAMTSYDLDDYFVAGTAAASARALRQLSAPTDSTTDVNGAVVGATEVVVDNAAVFASHRDGWIRFGAGTPVQLLWANSLTNTIGLYTAVTAADNAQVDTYTNGAQSVSAMTVNSGTGVVSGTPDTDATTGLLLYRWTDADALFAEVHIPFEIDVVTAPDTTAGDLPTGTAAMEALGIVVSPDSTCASAEAVGQVVSQTLGSVLWGTGVTLEYQGTCKGGGKIRTGLGLWDSLRSFFMKFLAGFALLLLSTAVLAQSTTRVGPVDDFNITSFPLYGGLVTPHDTNVLASPGMIRADADGTVTAACFGAGGNTIAAAITLELVAGEFFPCIVSYVLDTGTDAITIHIFY